jgi:hypothetical protein
VSQNKNTRKTTLQTNLNVSQREFQNVTRNRYPVRLDR